MLMIKKPYFYSLLAISTILSPSEESYIIEIPKTININESGNFNINIKNNNLDNNTLLIDFDDEFILTDSHGGEDIYGQILNNEIEINNEDDNILVNYTSNCGDKFGEYEGTLNFSIKLKQSYPTNKLIDGQSINNILSSIKPNIITFSHDKVDTYDYKYDISLAQDESIVLYDLYEEVIISNNADKQITCNEDMSHLFDNISNLITINNLDYLDTSTCNDISYMFYNDYNLKNINGLNNFNTINVTNMSNLFYNCKGLTSLDVSTFDTTNLINMSSMFEGIDVNLITGLSTLNVSNVENMSKTFKNCANVTELDVSTWNTSKVSDMSSMFEGCLALPKLTLNTFDVSNVENMSKMFSACLNITTVGNLSTWNTRSLTNTSYMFYNCQKLKSVVVTNFITDNVTDMSYMFYNLPVITSIGDISGWNVENVESFSHFINLCLKLKSFGDVSNWTVSDKCTDLSYMFASNSYTPGRTRFVYTIDTLDLRNWDVSNVTTLEGMFYNNFIINTINCTGWNVEKVETMKDFFGMHDGGVTASLTTLVGFDTWNTHNIKDMSYMFADCLQLHDTNSFANWDLSSVKDLSYSFYEDKYLTVSQFFNWFESKQVALAQLDSMEECFGMNPGFLLEPVGYKELPSWYVS